MDKLIFKKLIKKAIENNIDILGISGMNGNMNGVIINYFDGEIDFEQHKLKEKMIEVDLWVTLDEVIQKIKSKKFVPTKENHKEEGEYLNKIDLLKEILNNPRVDSTNINIERIGDVEETHINVKLKGQSTTNIRVKESSGLFENEKYMND